MDNKKAVRIKDNSFISLKNLLKVYPNGEKAVYNFDLDIEKNEFIVIVGPSGCGKSTTLRMIAGLEDITAGDIFMEGELLNYKPCKDRRMAIVFQSYALYPQMNVYDNIAFPLEINKFKTPVLEKKLIACSHVREIIASCDYAKICSALSEAGKVKNKKKQKENFAAIFDIGFESAQLLYELFVPYKRYTMEQMLSSETEIKADWLAQIAAAEEKEKRALAEKGIRYNENFIELDENGNEKTEFRKLTPYEIKVKVYETAEKLDLTPYLDKLPKELSGGQMQRVALGRAIVKNVPVFLMDEPLSNLDAKLRLTMRSEIVKLHNRINATTIYVTHDQTEAMTMATRIVVMSKGFVQQIGTPEEVYNAPVNLFVGKFIGSPPMNIFDVCLNIQEKRLEGAGVEIPVPESFLVRHREFYERKIREFEGMLEDFDESAAEKVLKILSVTGEYADRKKKQVKASIWSNLKRASKKAPKTEDFISEKKIAEQKLEKLKKSLISGEGLVAGIRPERFKIKKCDASADMNVQGGFIVQPTVCELLGGEYNVHFDYCGKDMVGQMDAKTKISTKDTVFVRFSAEDIYLFDPITGDIIQ